jgi:hypothetical protein
VPERQVVGWFEIQRKSYRNVCSYYTVLFCTARRRACQPCECIGGPLEGSRRGAFIKREARRSSVMAPLHAFLNAAGARRNFAPDRFPVFVVEEAPGGAAYYGFPEHGDLPGGHEGRRVAFRYTRSQRHAGWLVLIAS